MKEFLVLVLVVILVFAFVIGLTVAVGAMMGPPSCKAKTAEMGYPSKWGFWSGCLIEVEEGRWIPLDNYREFGE